MRTAGLLAPRRLGPPNGDPAHAGTIITTRPDEMWGTDATRFYTERDGWCWFFGAIDHHLDELVGWHVAKLGDRWAALEPSARACTTPSAGSARTSRGASRSAATAGRASLAPERQNVIHDERKLNT
jgi:putative transposase